MLKTWGGAGEAGWGDGSRGATRPAQAGGVHVRRQAAHRAGDAFTSQSHAPSRTCHAVPTLVVAKVSLPRRWMAKGTSSTTCPKARNGSNRAIPMQFLCSSHGDEKCRSKTRRLGPCAPAYQAPGPRGRLHSTPIPRPGGGPSLVGCLINDEISAACASRARVIFRPQEATCDHYIARFCGTLQAPAHPDCKFHEDGPAPAPIRPGAVPRAPRVQGQARPLLQRCRELEHE